MSRAVLPGHCQVCGKKGAPFGLGWPSLPQYQPAGIRGKWLKICGLSGDCAARAVIRAEKAAGVSWPWTGVWLPLRPSVAAIKGESLDPAAPDLTAAIPTPPAPRQARGTSPEQPSLI